MHAQERRVYKLIEPAVVAFGYELLGVQVLREGANPTLRIYIDKSDGITVDDCAKVSHQVSGVLDIEDPIAGEYALEVSSPGLDRPLFTPHHYQQFAGSRVKFRFYAPYEGRRKLKGELLGLQGDRVRVQETADKIWEIPLDLIAQARLVPTD